MLFYTYDGVKFRMTRLHPISCFETAMVGWLTLHAAMLRHNAYTTANFERYLFDS